MDNINDIERILSEEPLEIKKETSKKKNIDKKFNINKKFIKKAIITISFIILLITIFLLIPNGCEVCKGCELCIQDISIHDIRDQIINKGYVELDGGELILAPYLE